VGIRGKARAPIRGWVRALIRGWGAAPTRGRVLVRTSGRRPTRTRDHDLTPGPGPGRIRDWAPRRGRVHSPATSLTSELILGGKDRRTGRPAPTPGRSSAHGHGQARRLAPPIHGHAPPAARTPIRLALRPRALVRRPLPAPCEPGRPTHGPVPAAPVPAVLVPAARAAALPAGVAPKRPVPVPAIRGRPALVPAARRVAARPGEDPEAGARAGSQARIVSPARTATRVMSPTRTRRPAAAGRLGPRVTVGLAGASRVSRAGMAGPSAPSRAATKKPAAGPAVRPGQARRWSRPTPISQNPAGGPLAGAG